MLIQHFARMESIERSSHKVVVEQAKRLLCDLLADPFLSDISPTATHDEVASQLTLEQGRAITVHVRRFDDQVLCKRMNVCVYIVHVRCNQP